MKKTLVLLLLAALVAPIFADDAKVLPSRIGRLYVVPAYTMWSQGFDSDGEKVDNSYGDAGVVSVAAALEYGITDFLSFGFKYVPGYVVSSSFADDDNLDSTGTSGADIGLKIQLVGPSAFVQSDTMRFALVPGVNVPFASYDAEAEATAMGSGDTYSGGPVSSTTFGLGVQASFDYVVNDSFYVNLFSEFRNHIPAPVSEVGLTEYSVYGGVATAIYTNYSVSIAEPEISTGYDLTIELEPSYETSLGGGMTLSASVAATYDMNSGVSLSDYDAGTGVDAIDEAATTNLEDSFESYGLGASNVLSITPSVSLFLTSLPLPMEFAIDAVVPVMGENERNATTVLLTWKTYFRT